MKSPQFSRPLLHDNGFHRVNVDAADHPRTTKTGKANVSTDRTRIAEQDFSLSLEMTRVVGNAIVNAPLHVIPSESEKSCVRTSHVVLFEAARPKTSPSGFILDVFAILVVPSIP